MFTQFPQFSRKGLAGDPVPARHQAARPAPAAARVEGRGVLLAVVVLVALFAPLIARTDPLDQQLPVDGTGHPSADHWMGQDSLGRDTLSRLMYGAVGPSRIRLGRPRWLPSSAP
ncbi:hypothetical protein ACRAWF_33800 [Streptomyces sp. L7]